MPARPINMVLHTTTVTGVTVRSTVRSIPNVLNGSMISNANSGKSGCKACGH